MKIKFMLPVVLFGILLLAACGGQATPDPVEVAQLVETSVAATVQAMPTDTPVPVPTDTPEPVPTNTPVQILGLEDRIPPRQDYDHSYDITEKFDRFKSETSVALSSTKQDYRLWNHGGLVAAFTYEGETPNISPFVLFGFSSIQNDWKYLGCHNLDLLLNDEQGISLETEHEGDVGNGGKVIEFVFSTLPISDFLDIVNANRVEGRLCTDEFVLTTKDMAALRDFASRMQ